MYFWEIQPQNKEKMRATFIFKTEFKFMYFIKLVCVCVCVSRLFFAWSFTTTTTVCVCVFSTLLITKINIERHFLFPFVEKEKLFRKHWLVVNVVVVVVWVVWGDWTSYVWVYYVLWLRLFPFTFMYIGIFVVVAGFSIFG